MTITTDRQRTPHEEARLDVLNECLDALGEINGKYLNADDDPQYLSLARHRASHEAVSAIKNLRDEML